MLRTGIETIICLSPNFLYVYVYVYVLVVPFRLSIPVQVIDWKDVSEMTYNVLMGTLNSTHSLTHSLTADCCW